jgi:hypothetical protein
VSVQVLPEQSPAKYWKFEEGPAVAVMVTTVPASKLAEHVPPQLIPAGEETKVPRPEPVCDTVRVYGAATAPKHADNNNATRSTNAVTAPAPFFLVMAPV